MILRSFASVGIRYYTQRTALVVDGMPLFLSKRSRAVQNFVGCARRQTVCGRRPLGFSYQFSLIHRVGLRCQLARRYCSPDKTRGSPTEIDRVLAT